MSLAWSLFSQKVFANYYIEEVLYKHLFEIYFQVSIETVVYENILTDSAKILAFYIPLGILTVLYLIG